MNINKNNLLFKDFDHLARFITRCLVNIVCVLLGIFIGLKLLLPYWTDIINDCTIFDISNISDNDAKFLKLMIEHNKIHTADMTVSRLIGFYETLIQFLVGLFAIFGVLGFIYIKFSYRRDIGESIQDFIESNAGKLVLKDMFEKYIKAVELKPIVKEVFNDEKNSGDISYILEDNTMIHDKIETIEKEQSNIIEDIENLKQSIDKNTSIQDEINEPN